MRKFGDFIAMFVPGVVVGATLMSTLMNAGYLWDVGGWLAILGHVMSVGTTLTMLIVSIVLGLTILALPFFLLFCFIDPASEIAFDMSDALRSPRSAAGIVVARAGRGALAAADPVWKGVWWTWWLVAGRRRSDS